MQNPDSSSSSSGSSSSSSAASSKKSHPYGKMQYFFRKYGQELQYEDLPIRRMSKEKRKAEEDHANSQVFINFLKASVFRGQPLHLDALAYILMPDFTNIHENIGDRELEWRLSFHSNFIQDVSDRTPDMIKDMRNAVLEIRYLKAAFNRLKRVHGDKVNVSMLFSDKLRVRLHQQWLHNPLYSISINGTKFRNTVGFSLGRINAMSFGWYPISFEKGYELDWYDKFLASVYLHWFLFRQSHDIWKIRQSGNTLKGKQTWTIWPGALKSIKNNSWIIIDQTVFNVNKIPKKARYWNDPRFLSISELPGLTRRTITEEERVIAKKAASEWVNDPWSSGRTFKWTYSPAITIPPEGIHKKLRFYVTELAFDSLRIASMIRVPTVSFGTTMLPADGYGGKALVNTKAPTKVEILFVSRPPPFLLFDQPTYILASRDPTQHFHYWIGGGSEKKGISLTIVNVKFISMFNISEVISRIWRIMPDEHQKRYIAIQGTSMHLQYAIRGGRLILPRGHGSVLLRSLSEDEHKYAGIAVKEGESFRRNIYGGVIMSYPLYTSRNFIEVPVVGLSMITVPDTKLWLKNLQL